MQLFSGWDRPSVQLIILATREVILVLAQRYRAAAIRKSGKRQWQKNVLAGKRGTSAAKMPFATTGPSTSQTRLKRTPPAKTAPGYSRFTCPLRISLFSRPTGRTSRCGRAPAALLPPPTRPLLPPRRAWARKRSSRAVLQYPQRLFQHRPVDPMGMPFPTGRLTLGQREHNR